jgi:hypothetical protein
MRLMNTRSDRDLTRHRGQVLVIAGIALPILLGVAALAIDFGTYLVTQRYVYNAADGAALAGAAELGDRDLSLASSRLKEAQQAALYLDEILSLSMSSGELAALAATVNSPNGYCYPDPGDCAGARLQMWMYNPAPPADATATDGLPHGIRQVYRDPQKFPSRSRSMFVRVDRPGALFFGQIFNVTPPVIHGQAIAAPSGHRCAVAALKPRLDSPDNELGITLNNAQIRVQRGDVCSNYSIDWAGGGAQVIFTPGNDQVVYLAEPGAMQGSPSVVNGTFDILSDQVEDPRYVYPLPGSTNPVHRPPSGAFPPCVTAADRLAGIVQCSSGMPSTVTLWPGKYQLIDIPSGTTVTLSRDCFAGDTCQPGVYWISLDTCGSGPLHKGGLWLKGATPASSITGQGVLLAFDPCETNPYSVTFEVSSTNATLHLNDSAAMKTTANPGGTIPFAWYNPSDTDPLNDPVTVWVRPNYVTGLATYSMSAVPGSGSHVVEFSSLPLISESGLIYAPEDNSKIVGNGGASGVGQVISWTITYSGAGSSLTQNFAGGAADRSRLIQ